MMIHKVKSLRRAERGSAIQRTQNDVHDQRAGIHIQINVDPTSSTLNAVGSGGRDARKRELMKAHRAVPNGAQETWRCAPPVRTEYWQGGVKAVIEFSCMPPVRNLPVSARFLNGTTAVIHPPPPESEPENRSTVNHKESLCDLGPRKLGKWSASVSLRTKDQTKPSLPEIIRIRDRVLAVVGMFSGCCSVLEHTNDQATPHILHTGCRSPHAIDDS
ncbi:hypothetical protein B0H13DRAFT_1910114 [Mycena leptocephala]|nr:hypothetical protein B0H13DRAFT_1910114 [Mycena leptocephala]